MRLPVAICLVGSLMPCRAEITLDGSLGPKGALMPDPGNEINIEAGMGRQAGSNLFHSFGVFNVNAGETATFNDTGATGPVENILSRVTGGGSRIDGMIKTSFQSSDPNLFLLNPAGVVFGPKASLNVEGSFHASTGGFIELADGVQFTARPSPNDALLSTAPPAAFGFLSDNQAGIEVKGASLHVGSGKSLSVVAPNINIDGSGQNGLFAGPAGTVNIVSIEGPGEARIGGDKVTLPTDQSRGRIVISNGVLGSTLADLGTDGSHINIIGGDVEIADSFVISNSLDAPGQGIKIDADNLRLNGALFFSQAWGNAPGGAVEIDADSEARLDRNVIDTESFGLGQAGDIFISADMLDMGLSTLIASGTADGRAGNITVQANADVTLSGGSTMFAEGTTQSAGGNISVTANILRMEDGAGITTATFSSEQAGVITLEAADTIALTGDKTLITSRSDGAGKAGDINIKTSNLNLAGGAKITGEALGFGSAAKIVVEAAQGVTLSGEGTVITSGSDAQGRAGDLTIETESLTLSDGAQFAANTVGPGSGGSVTVNTANLSMDNGKITTSTTGPGDAGTVSVSANNASLTRGARIESTTNTAGNAGDITVRANDGGVLDLSLSSGAQITASTSGLGEGGSINIDGGGGTVSLSGQPTAITSETSGDGDAGSIAIRAGRLTVRDGATISASTSGNGKGGSVNIQTSNIELLNGGEIEARSDSRNDSGESGSLSIRADDTIRVFNGSSINVRTEQADAGDIDLSAGFLLHLRDNSSITTSVAGGQGNGGNIRIHPVFTVLDGGSSIIANARQGQAGNIRIVSDFFFASPDSVVRASNDRDIQGVVDIESPESDVVSGALELPASFLDVASLLSDRCSAGAAKGASRFIVSGRGGVPPGPETVLPSQVELGATPEEIRSHDSTSGSLSNTSLALSPVAIGCSANGSLREHGFGQRFENAPWQ